MLMRTLRLPLVVMAAAVLTGGVAWGEGLALGQTKEELKLDYEVSVPDHGTGRVTVVLTLADEGRLKPLDEVQVVIPGQETEKDGGRYMDLVVSMDMQRTYDGRRVGRVHVRKDLAERAEIQLNTHTMDGKYDPMTRLHHVIPLAKYLGDVPASEVAIPKLVSLELGTSIPLAIQSAGVAWKGYTFHLVSLGSIRFDLDENDCLKADIQAGLTSFDDVDYDISGALFDAAGQLLGSARAQCKVQRMWTGGGVRQTAGTITLDFGASLDYARATAFAVSVSNQRVLTPDDWQK